MCRKLFALMTALALILGCAGAYAENTKHERVYVVTDADGNVRSLVDSIRLENADQAQEIRDRTLLSDVNNMGGDEPFARDGETLVWQAAGRDIVYQGTSDAAPSILPIVSLTLDGEQVTAEELANKTGEAVLTVTYRVAGTVPALALSVLPLPEEGVSDLKTENCAVLTEMGQRLLLGWALPGLAPEWLLPASFTASFHADHADLKWIMTLITADPLDIACRTISSNIPLGLSPRQLLEDAEKALTALQNGEDVPALRGLAQLASGKINELNNGLTQLNDGAVQLSDGTRQLKDGAAQLKTGTMLALVAASSVDESIKKLQGNSEDLNTGAARMADALLNAAKTQLAAAGYDVPDLTLDNYAEALETLAAGLPEGAADARNALNAVREQLDQAKTFVSGVKSYTDGVDRAAAVSAQVKSGMKQLDDGVKTLQDGAKQLADGASTLQKDGTQKLKDTFLNAEQLIAKTLLPYLQNQAAQALDLYEAILSPSNAIGYDLRPDGMTTITVFLVRTDLR